MKKVVLVRYGEINLKGDNKYIFENKLMNHIKKVIAPIGRAKVLKYQSRVFIELENQDFDFQGCQEKLSEIFGIVSTSLCEEIPSDFDTICEASHRAVSERLARYPQNKTFKVDARRSDKSFFLTSPQIAANLGAFLLDAFPDLSVDVKMPDFVISVEVRDVTYIFHEVVKGPGGMPVGSSNRAMLLLSGGIDSPVAGYMIAKRGVRVCAVHYHSFPYTSEQAKEKVIDLSKILSRFTGPLTLYLVPFTAIQLEIHENAPAEYGTILTRRYMMKIAQMIAEREGAIALATGECIGQVASQTLESLLVTNESVTLPVLRPLIAMDKNEVIEIARKIGTFETSIQPYDDCCTLFLARHPVTKPSLSHTKEYETTLQMDDRIHQALLDTQKLEIISGQVRSNFENSKGKEGRA